MWEDDMYLTSQSDDANTGAILFNMRTWMPDHTIFLSQQTKYSMCLIHCLYCYLHGCPSILWPGACKHSVLLAEQGPEGLQNKSVQRLLKLRTWLYLSFTQQLSTGIFSVH